MTRPDYAATALQRREFVTRAEADTEGRTIAGTAVPWDTEVEIYPGFFERWAPGAAESPEAGTLMLYRHGEPIGRFTEQAKGETGWEVSGPVSDTTLGRDALVLVNDQVLTQLSVGFRALEWDEHTDEDGVHVTIRRAVVPEVSLVPFGAYGTAAPITGTRAAGPTTDHRTTDHKEHNTMPEDTTTTELPAEVRAQLETLTDDVADVRQRLVVMADGAGTQVPEAHPALRFRSIGEYARALATGDADAADVMRRAGDLEDELAQRAVTTDDTITATGSNWVGNVIRMIRARQRILRLFGHTYDLPSTGMTVEFGTLVSNTIATGEQVAQGDALTYGELKLGTDNAPVQTFGGYTELPRQVIERSAVSYLDFVFEAFAIAYGRGMELHARGQLDALVAAQAGAAIVAGKTLETTTDLDWLSFIIDADEQLDDAGHALQGLVVSKEVFMQLASVEAPSRLLRWAGSPDERHGGTLQVSGGPSAELLNIPVTVNPSWKGTEQVAAFDPFALRTREAPGAPFRLQDENVVNLSKQFSVYGYAATVPQAPGAIVPVTFAAA